MSANIALPCIWNLALIIFAAALWLALNYWRGTAKSGGWKTIRHSCDYRCRRADAVAARRTGGWNKRR